MGVIKQAWIEVILELETVSYHLLSTLQTMQLLDAWYLLLRREVDDRPHLSVDSGPVVSYLLHATELVVHFEAIGLAERQVLRLDCVIQVERPVEFAGFAHPHALVFGHRDRRWLFGSLKRLLSSLDVEEPLSRVVLRVATSLVRISSVSLSRGVFGALDGDHVHSHFGKVLRRRASKRD